MTGKICNLLLYSYETFSAVFIRERILYFIAAILLIAIEWRKLDKSNNLNDNNLVNNGCGECKFINYI